MSRYAQHTYPSTLPKGNIEVDCYYRVLFYIFLLLYVIIYFTKNSSGFFYSQI